MADTVEAVGDVAGLGDAVEDGAGFVDVGRRHDGGEDGLDWHVDVELKTKGRIPIGRGLVQGSLTDKCSLGRAGRGSVLAGTGAWAPDAVNVHCRWG